MSSVLTCKLITPELGTGTKTEVGKKRRLDNVVILEHMKVGELTLESVNLMFNP